MTQLKLDIDDTDYQERSGLIVKITGKIRDTFNLHILEHVAYESQHEHIHMIINVRENLTNSEIVMLQYALGSDPRREYFNARRVMRMRQHPVSRFWKKRWNTLYAEKL